MQRHTHPVPPEAFTVAEAVRASGIGRTRVYELIRDGQLDARKLGAKTLILADSLRGFLASLPPVRREAA